MWSLLPLAVRFLHLHSSLDGWEEMTSYPAAKNMWIQPAPVYYNPNQVDWTVTTSPSLWVVILRLLQFCSTSIDSNKPSETSQYGSNLDTQLTIMWSKEAKTKNACCPHNDSIRVIAFVGGDLHTHWEAFDTQIKVRTFVTLDSDRPRDVLITVIAVI